MPLSKIQKREYDREWRKRNRAEVNARSLRRYHSLETKPPRSYTKEWHNDYLREWRKVNRESSRRTSRVQSSKRRARQECLDPRRARHYYDIVLHDPCSYCGKTTSQVDHIQPLSRDGEHEWFNFTGTCAKCNQQKGSTSLLMFLLKRNELCAQK